ncbi:MAG: hypothetical protein AABX03_01405 [Nanoarchaeota archaeon]
MKKYCNECTKPISEDVYRVSTKHYSRALCEEHQPNQAKKSYYNKPGPTPEARRLGELLIKYGYKVEYEKYDGYKHIDIAIVNKKVNIEVDGGQHHSKTQALRDLKRTFYSWEKSFVTLRIPNSLTKDDITIKETAEYIDKFLKTERTQLEKEIRGEYIEEDNLIWEDVNNFVNGFNDIIKNVSNVVNHVGNSFSNALKRLPL